MSTIKVDNIQTTGGAGLYPARAWVTWDGTTNTILSAGNVSSLTDNGTGQYTVNFSTAMPNQYYSVSAGCPSYNPNDIYRFVMVRGSIKTPVTKTTTACALVTGYQSVFDDPKELYFQVFG